MRRFVCGMQRAIKHSTVLRLASSRRKRLFDLGLRFDVKRWSVALFNGFGIGAMTTLGMLVVPATPSLGGTITNASFEPSLAGWTLAGNIGRVSSSFGKTPTDGTRMAYMVSQNSLVNGVTTAAAGGTGTPQVSAASLASSLGTTTSSLNTVAGAGNSVTTGASATGGSGMFQSISVNAGETLSFQWSFLTAEDIVLRPSTSNNDFAFVSIDSVVTVLGRLDELATDPNDTSAFQYIPFTGGAVDGSNVESFLFETGDGTGSAAVRLSDYNMNTGSLFGADNFKTFSFTFPAGGLVGLGFGVINVHTSGSTGSIPSVLLVDNLRLTAAIPEPTSMFLMLGSMVGCRAFLRRRARS